MGQAKVRYFDRRQPWMKRILVEIDGYRGPSLVTQPEAEVEAIAAEAGEAGQAGGQGFAIDPRVRRLVEQRAMALAKKTYDAAGYDVRVVGHPFDLHCRSKTGFRKQVWASRRAMST